MINMYAQVWVEMNTQQMDNVVVSRQGIKIWRESQGKYLLFLYDLKFVQWECFYKCLRD